MTEQQTLLVAQVLTLASALELLNRVQNKNISTDYEREAAKLIARRGPAVLEHLAQAARTSL
jgi:hypothetical protein